MGVGSRLRLTVSGGLGIEAADLHAAAKHRGAAAVPEFLAPMEELIRLKRDGSNIAVLNAVHAHALERGDIDPKKVETAVTNVVVRANCVQGQRFYPHVDVMLALLDSALNQYLPTDGPAGDTVKDYRILRDFIKAPRRKQSTFVKASFSGASVP